MCSGSSGHAYPLSTAHAMPSVPSFARSWRDSFVFPPSPTPLGTFSKHASVSARSFGRTSDPVRLHRRLVGPGDFGSERIEFVERAAPAVAHVHRDGRLGTEGT